MITISKDEAEIIKRQRALPKRIIEDRIKELSEELLTCQEETMLRKRGTINELKKWLMTVGIFEKKKDTNTKEDFI